MPTITINGVSYELPENDGVASKVPSYNEALIALAAAHEELGSGARVYHNANISIPDSTLTTLNFNSERYDTSAIHSTSTNNERLTFPLAGCWRITANIRFAVNSTGIRGALLYLDGSTLIGYTLTPNAGATFPTIIQVTADWTVAANDYAIVKAQQTSGGALNVEVDAAYSPEFWCEYLGS